VQMTMLIGRILTDGRMSARIKYDVTDRFSIKVNAQITNEPHFSQGMFHFDYRGGDYQAQLQLGNNAFYGFNYIQVHSQQPFFQPPGLCLSHIDCFCMWYQMCKRRFFNTSCRRCMLLLGHWHMTGYSSLSGIFC
jgi:hypothetical protein